MRLFEDVRKQSYLMEQTRGAGLQYFTAELALEVLVCFEHNNVGPALGEEQSEQQPAGSSSHNARPGANNRTTARTRLSVCLHRNAPVRRRIALMRGAVTELASSVGDSQGSCDRRGGKSFTTLQQIRDTPVLRLPLSLDALNRANLTQRRSPA